MKGSGFRIQDYFSRIQLVIVGIETNDPTILTISIQHPNSAPSFLLLTALDPDRLSRRQWLTTSFPLDATVPRGLKSGLSVTCGTDYRVQ